MKIHLALLDPIEDTIPCKNKLRKWAAENAYTLLLMAILFGFTWTAMILYGVWEFVHGR